MNVYLSLGSNLGNRQEILEKAYTLINIRIGAVLSRSSFYKTLPWGFHSDHPFLNACCLCITEKSPLAVLRMTQEIEKELGRKHKSENGVYHDRPLDIDLLLCDNQIIHTPELTIPHPLMQERRFVLEPLNEIAPDVIHPVLNLSVSELLSLCKP